MRSAFLVCKKEFIELAKDRKTLFFTFLLPFLLYPVLFGMMSKLSKRDSDQRKSKPSRVWVIDPGSVILPLLKAQPTKFEMVEAPKGEFKQALKDQKLEMVLNVPADAPQMLAAHQTFEVKATVDESDRSGSLALSRLKSELSVQNKAWVKGRLESLKLSGELAEPSRLETEDAGGVGLMIGKTIGSFLPYLIMLMMFAGAMQHGIYATAGEKERGTMLSLLATSMPRNQIIWGKLIYVYAVGILSVIVNMASMALSFLLLSKDAMAAKGPEMQAAVQAAGMGTSGLEGISAIISPMVLGTTFLLLLPLGLLFANFIVLMGTQAKNTVEAGSAMMPGFLVVMGMAVFSMAPGIEKMAFLPYVPVVNVSLAIRKVFSQQGDALEIAVAFVMTVALAGAMTWLSTRLLNRESVLFKV